MLTTLLSTKQAHMSQVFLFISFFPIGALKIYCSVSPRRRGGQTSPHRRLYNRVFAALIIDGNDVDADKVKVMMEVKGFCQFATSTR